MRSREWVKEKPVPVRPTTTTVGAVHVSVLLLRVRTERVVEEEQGVVLVPRELARLHLRTAGLACPRRRRGRMCA
jgi:hypothetical protein